MAETTRLHVQSEIDNLLAVANRFMIGHVFVSQYSYPVVVYQEPDDVFEDREIRQGQDFLALGYEEPYVYDGVLDETEALSKAMELRRQNCALFANQE